MRLSLFAFFCIFTSAALSAQDSLYSVSGYVQDNFTGEPILGAYISTSNGKQIATSNRYGYYSLSLKSGIWILEVSAEGYQRYMDTVDLNVSKVLNLNLKKIESSIKEINITAKRVETEVKSTRISVINLKPANIRNIPTIGGELDILKVAQLLPGIQKGAEGQTGFQVRGGDPDQNLLILDDATVYNVSHLFGFFSVFIPEAIEDMDIYKGGFPAEYGGRLSSIFDIRLKEGNKSKVSGSGGVGILSSRLTLEIPIIKNKASWIISGRRTYIDRVLKLAKFNLPYYFYDINSKFSYSLSKNDKIFASFYLGNDVLKEESQQNTDSGNVLATKFGFQLGNISSTLRWNHVVNPKIFLNSSLIYTRFRYFVEGEFGDNSIFIGSRIQDIGAKTDLSWYKNNQNTYRFGISVINHTFKPNVISTKGAISQFLKDTAPTIINTQELGLFARNEKTVSTKLKINYGLRLSACLTQGKLYGGIEPRIAAVYEVGKLSSLKFGYARMKQYLHLVSSSSVSLPTDLWYPVTKNIKPQKSDQITIAYQHAFPKREIFISTELYYKTMTNSTEYREGAVLILNNNYEKELLQGRGYSYGAEFLVKRDKGRLNGWVGYTLGWSNRIFAELNQGKMYPAKYDRRHYLSVVANYTISRKWDLGMVWVYNTGSRFTAQVGKYFMPKPGLNGVDIVPVYTTKNAVHLSPSHRLDLNLIYKVRQTKKFKAEWVLSSYNTYNRAEPYRIRISVDPTTGGLKYEQPGLFGTLISLAYNFKF